MNQPTSSFSAGMDQQAKAQSSGPKQSKPEKREIDRFDFLNDDFDDDPDDDDRVPVENQAVDDFDVRDGDDNLAGPNSAQKIIFKFHEPFEGERAFRTLDHIKDTSLFNSRLSQA